MLIVLGSRVRYRTVGHGDFHCEKCGGDRPYTHRSGRRWALLLGIPVLPRGDTGEHLRCASCLTCYRVELLAVPTVEQMQLALLAGTTASVLAMLRAGNAANPAAQHRAIEAIRSAGAPDCDEPALVAALAGLPAELSVAPGLRPAVEALAVQLEMQARDWFLATVIQVGLAAGPLAAAEREVVETVAGYLGMSRVRARNVISLAEESAQAG